MRVWRVPWSNGASIAAVCLAIASAVISLPATAAPGILYEKDSLFGRVTVKEDEAGLRSLHFGRDGARQTVVKPGDPDHLELPYARVAMIGLAMTEHVRRVLVVGLGGGSLPSFLRKQYPAAEIDAVDIDPVVIEVAKEFFEFREDGRMRAHLADGRGFIEAARRPYDVIFLDAFGSDSVPERLTTVEFLRAVRQALTPGGVVVGNIWGPYANRLYHSMVRTYRETFEELVVLDVKGAGNKILIALPRKGGINKPCMITLGRRLKSELRLRFDLGELVDFGYPVETEGARRGTVLRDRNLGRLE
ncbi:MAG: methyltransferase domain-containing protein [Betaproteobacteria bacterium]|nr:methyltransferase domain-containing protein [Betaproteobacteria bacterium]